MLDGKRTVITGHKDIFFSSETQETCEQATTPWHLRKQSTRWL